MPCVKVPELRLGLMEVNTSGNGGTIKRMEREFYTIRMEMCMKASGSMTKQMAKAPTRILTGPNMSESGRMTSKTVLGLNSG